MSQLNTFSKKFTINMNITLLKLGGSLITDKNKPYTARPAMIEQVVSEIATAVAAQPDLHLVLGNGAGSYAHQSAAQYKTIDGATSPEDMYGACVVHRDATRLHNMLIDACLEKKLPVYSMQPSALFMTENKQFCSGNYWILSTVLQNNMIPFLYGDVMIDKKIGATIYSTETLFAVLATFLPVVRDYQFTIDNIILAGDYDGVYDEQKNVIPEINTANFTKVKKHIGNSEHLDVTGGMVQKVQESLSIAQKGIDSHIINGSMKGNIAKALNGDCSFGTRITK